MKHDIVYILQNGYDRDEIVYSLRSVYVNFPHNKVWIYGGKPENVAPDHFVEYKQEGTTRWEKVANTIRAICENDGITEDFWLFNDDFFIMKKVRGTPQPMVGGSLWMRADTIAKKYGGSDSLYSERLRNTAKALKRKGYDRLDYALHVPMLINRKKGIETLDEFFGEYMFRSLYGNHHRIGGVYTDDVKVADLETVPKNLTYLSTDDKSWNEGAVGRYIREAFPVECKYDLR